MLRKIPKFAASSIIFLFFIVNKKPTFTFYYNTHSKLMNILAHLYLSQEINQIMLGNFIGDFVKGNKFNGYPTPVMEGILLHRKIDTYTDAHKLHRKSRDRYRPGFRLHSGIVVDIIYDHFLAKNWDNYHNLPLEQYAQTVYRYLNENQNSIPERMQEMLPYMINGNWLVLYSTLSGIERVLQGMTRRTSMPNQVEFAMKITHDHYSEIEKEFTLFFSKLEHYSKIELELLNQKNTDQSPSKLRS